MKRRISFLLFLALGGTLAAQAPEAPPSTLTLGYTINGGSREFYVFNTTQEARSGIVVVTLFDKAGNRTGDNTYECAIAPRSNSPSLATVPNDGSSAKAQFSDERVITDYKPGTNLGGVCEVGAASESVKKAKAILAACKLFARDNSGALPLELEE